MLARIDADPAVLHPQPHAVRVRLGADAKLGMLPRGGELQRVADQIGQDLLEPHRIGAHRRQGLHHPHHRPRLFDRRPVVGQHPGHHRLERGVDELYLRAGDSTVGQQIVDQAVHAPGGRKDEAQAGVARGRQHGVRVLQHRLHEAVDVMERRAQIVRRRVGEGLQLAVHLLQPRRAQAHLVFQVVGVPPQRGAGLGEFRVGPALGVDVGGAAHPLHHPSPLVAPRHGEAEEPVVVAARVAQAMFHPVGVAGAHRLVPPARGGLQVVGMNDGPPVVIPRLERAEAGVFQPAPVDVVPPAQGVRGPDVLRHGVGEETVALQQFGQLALGFLALGNVDHQREVADHLPVLGDVGGQDRAHPASVAAPIGHVGFEAHLLARQHAVDLVLDAGVGLPADERLHALPAQSFGIDAIPFLIGLVCQHVAAVLVHAGHEGGHGVHDQFQLGLLSPERLLRLHPRADVGEGADPFLERAVGRDDHRGAGVHVAVAPVPRAQPIDAFPLRPGGAGAAPLLHHPGPVVGMDALGPLRVDVLFRAATGELLPALRVLDPPVRARRPHDGGARRDERAVAALAALDRGGHAARLGDVKGVDDHAAHRAVRSPVGTVAHHGVTGLTGAANGLDDLLVTDVVAGERGPQMRLRLGVARLAEQLPHGLAPDVFRVDPQPEFVLPVVQHEALVRVDVGDHRRHRVDDRLEQVALAVELGLHGLALGQVEHEREAAPVLGQDAAHHQDRHLAPVGADAHLLDRLVLRRRLEVLPDEGSETRRALPEARMQLHPTRLQVRAVVAVQPEKRVVRRAHLAVAREHAHAKNVRLPGEKETALAVFHVAPGPRLRVQGLAHAPVQARVVQGERGDAAYLRGQRQRVLPQRAARLRRREGEHADDASAHAQGHPQVGTKVQRLEIFEMRVVRRQTAKALLVHHAHQPRLALPQYLRHALRAFRARRPGAAPHRERALRLGRVGVMHRRRPQLPVRLVHQLQATPVGHDGHHRAGQRLRRLVQVQRGRQDPLQFPDEEEFLALLPGGRDVRARSDEALEPAVAPETRQRVLQYPAVGAVRPPQTVFHVVGLSRRPGLVHHPQHPRHVRLVDAPDAVRLRAHGVAPREGQPGLVDEIRRAVRAGRPHETGRVVRHVLEVRRGLSLRGFPLGQDVVHDAAQDAGHHALEEDHARDDRLPGRGRHQAVLLAHKQP